MAKRNEIFPSKYLKAGDLAGKSLAGNRGRATGRRLETHREAFGLGLPPSRVYRNNSWAVAGGTANGVLDRPQRFEMRLA
jgi:hypothetical protein